MEMNALAHTAARAQVCDPGASAAPCCGIAQARAGAAHVLRLVKRRPSTSFVIVKPLRLAGTARLR